MSVELGENLRASLPSWVSGKEYPVKGIIKREKWVGEKKILWFGGQKYG